MEITSDLILLQNVELDPQHQYSIDFNTITEQQAYFESKKDVYLLEGEYSYIRQDEAIKVDIPFDDLENVNYMMFKNKDKWYYAFVTKRQYINPEVTKLYFRVDPLQTFMFDYELQESYIDREHQDRMQNTYDFKPIYNIQPENIEIGSDYEFVNKHKIGTTSINSNNNDMFYIIKAKEPLGKVIRFTPNQNELITINDKLGEVDNNPTKVGELSTGLYVYLLPVKFNQLTRIRTGEDKYISILNLAFIEYDAITKDIFENPKVVSVSLTRYLPDFYEGITEYDDGKGTKASGDTYKTEFEDGKSTINVGMIYAGTTAKLLTYPLIKIDKFIKTETYNNETYFRWREIRDNDFAPISRPRPLIINAPQIMYESKLNTYPYAFMRLNAYGETKDFKHENFKNGNSSVFSLYYSLGANGGTMIIPDDYNGTKSIYDNLSPKNKLDLTLRTDKWQEYVLQNKASLNGGLVVGGLQSLGNIALGALTGGIGLAIGGGEALGFAGQIAQDLMQRQNIKNQPDDVRGNISDTELITSVTNMEISFDELSIKEVYKNIVFKYFMHYGYKCNEFKIPNVRSRYYYNYIKTIGANIKSNINTDYIDEIKSIYDKGITLWHYRTPNTFKGVNNYNFENVEMNLIDEEEIINE